LEVGSCDLPNYQTPTTNYPAYNYHLAVIDLRVKLI
jgi:hypothetical protein